MKRVRNRRRHRQMKAHNRAMARKFGLIANREQVDRTRSADPHRATRQLERMLPRAFGR